jgi:hypothetical protein
MAYMRSISKPDQAPLPATSGEIYHLYVEEGCSMTQIASQLGCSRQRLARWMEYWGIVRRSSPEAARLKLQQTTGSRSPNWRGGSWVANGIRYVWTPGHPRASRNGHVPEHILVAEERLGRCLAKDEVVHHLDLDPLNNDPTNLCVMPRSTHAILHRALGDVGIKLLLTGETERVTRCLPSAELVQLVLDVYIRQVGLVEARPVHFGRRRTGNAGDPG